MSFFLALVIDGALSGAIYALIALAFVLVYKASSMMNFALGEWIMFGALLLGIGVHSLHLGAVAGLVFAGIAMIALAAGFYRLVIHRLVGRPTLSAIMATLGLGMIMRGCGPLISSGAQGFAAPSMAIDPMSIGEISITIDRLAVAGVAALCTVLIAGFYRFSRTGIALRAIADDPQVAISAGINVDRHLLFVWGLAGAVAVVAGVLWAYITGGGFGVALVGLKVFPIVILGGLDSIGGTAVAAITIGVIESLASGYLDEPFGSGFAGVAPFILLLATLTLRPYGLFGQAKVARI